MNWLTTQLIVARAWFQQSTPSGRASTPEDRERGDVIQWMLIALGGIAMAALVVGALTGKLQELIAQL